MTQFSVLPGSMSHAASATRAAADGLMRELHTLRRDVDDVLGGGWRGPAASHFGRAWLEWDDAAREVIAGLNELAEAVAASGREYEWRDDTSRSVLQRAALNL